MMHGVRGKGEEAHTGKAGGGKRVARDPGKAKAKIHDFFTFLGYSRALACLLSVIIRGGGCRVGREGTFPLHCVGDITAL